MPKKNIVWVVDDDESIRWVLEKGLSENGLKVETFESAHQVIKKLEEKSPEAILSDIKMPGTSGLALLDQVKEVRPDIPVIIMTAHSDLESAVESYEHGAWEYLPKPFDIDEATKIVKRAIASEEDLEEKIENAPKAEIIGEAPAMQEVFRAIGKLSNSNSTVLLVGSSGTGKELVAKAIHDFSQRSSLPFIVINMASLPKDLIESELFGYEKGAFTGAEKRTIGFFEKANSGTLFLDEIGDMPIEIQARLLRVLQFGEFSRVGGREIIKTDVRIISATNKNLLNLIDQKLFREDLYYRLNVINVGLPPLRDRENDILTLSDHFISKYSENSKKIDESGQTFLKKYHWPGNIRELENLIKRVCALVSEKFINSELLEQFIDENINNDEIKARKIFDDKNLSSSINNFFERFFDTLIDEKLELNLHSKFVAEIEKPLIMNTLKYFNGNQIKTAKLLGINRNTLRSKISRYKIPEKFGKNNA